MTENEKQTEVVDIRDIIPDSHNFNAGTEKGREMIEKSFRELGAGRSILLDKNNRIIAGNKSQQAAIATGITKVRIVDTDGDEIVAVRRRDVDLDSKVGRELAFADNATQQVSLAWDETELQAVQADVEGFDIADFGFDIEDLPQVTFPTGEKQGDGEDKPQTEVKEDDFDPDAHYETKVKAGEVWQLGEHRLMCGDSTDADAVAKLMNGERADLVFTAPPYGMKKESEGVLNDNLNFDDLLEFNKRWIPLTFANLKDNGSWYCWGIDEPLMDIYSNILRPMQKRNEITFQNLITWDKGSGQGQQEEGRFSYATADEKCLFVMCGTMTTTSDVCKGFEKGLSTWFEGFEKFRSYFDEQSKKAGLTRSDVKKLTNTSADHYVSKSQYAFPTKEHWDKIQAYCREKGIDAFTWDYNEMSEEYAKQRNGKEYAAILAKQAAKRKEWYDTRAYFNNTHGNFNNVWHFDRLSSADKIKEGIAHATPKPIPLCGLAIKTSSREGEIVLDVFGGSGSTMIACEQLGRKCLMMELDPHYCTVIIARWEKFTGQKAVKL